MYAITDTSYRAISHERDAIVGETIAAEVPQALLDSIQAAEDSRASTVSALHTQAEGAIDNLRAYRDLASPTNAQTIAVVKLLCRVAIVLIRLQLAKLDGTD